MAPITRADDYDEASSQAACSQDMLFCPGMYSPSGFDILKILYHVATRPNPVIDLGPVDASCPIVLCDLCLPDTPAVYASDSFLAVTGYSRDEILGHNCRFLQRPPSASNMPPPPLPHGYSSQYVPPPIRELLHDAVAHNKEVQVEVTNFRKDGSRWENVLSIVPIHWDDDARHKNDTCRSTSQPRGYRYAVGFVCDKTAMGM